MRICLLLVASFAFCQDSPLVRLANSAFIDAVGPVQAAEAYELRIALDSAGNRFTIQNSVELVSRRPDLYRAIGSLRKITASDAVTFTTRFEGKLTGLALDPLGFVWVSGFGGTSLQEASGFVAQVDPTGKVARTIPIEGTPTGLAIDPAGALYVTGNANKTFRPTSGAWKRDIGALRCSDKYATVYFACSEAFALKLSPGGASVVYATYIGGTQGETAFDIAIGADGSAYIAGETISDDFPISASAAQPGFGGLVSFGPLLFEDGFLVRLSPDGSRAIYSTYLGGPAPDRLYAIALEPDGGAFVTGRVDEAGAMPSTSGDTLLAHFDASGSLLKQTRFGTPNKQDYSTGVALANGRLFVNVLGTGVFELEANTLNRLRRAVPRFDGATAIATAAPGRVHVVANAVSTKTNVFAVSPGKPQYGSQYLAEYDFDQPAQPAVHAIVNAASYLQGRSFGGRQIAVSPGEIISVFGEKFQQPLALTLAGRTLPILYANETQINAVIPDDMPLGDAPVSVQMEGTTLGPWVAEVAPVVPALFTNADRIAAAINDDGTLNSMAHPAKAGSIVSLFATGLGALTNDTPLRRLRQHLQAFGPGGAGGGMEILYAGEAPGLPGVQQVNVRIGPIPASNTPYRVLIRLVFDLEQGNGEFTQDGVSIVVQ